MRQRNAIRALALTLVLSPLAFGISTRADASHASGAPLAPPRALAALGALAPAVAAQASLAAVVANPSQLDFGEVAGPVAGTGPASEVNLANTSASTVVRVSPPRIGGANAGDFTVLTSPPASWLLRPGDTYQFVVAFSPNGIGQRTAAVILTTNDPTQPTITIPLSGRGRSRSGGLGAVAGSRFIAVTPTRLLDTRAGTGIPGRLGATQTGTLSFAATTVPDTASAVVLNVTAVDAEGAGFVTVWPAGRDRPVASNLNTDHRGQTIANLVTASLGSGASLSFYVSVGMDLVADLAGFYVPSEPVAAGRFTPVMPARLIDTRTDRGVVSPDDDVSLAVAGRGGVPAHGASAVVLNVTSTEGTGAGFITIWPDDAPIPVVSNLNPERAGETIANAAVVRLPASGALRLHVKQPGHLVVDVVGWFTDGTAAVASRGLFSAQSPTRALDTRRGSDGTDGTGPRLAAGSTIVVSTTLSGVPADAIAAVTNVTATDALAPGFVTAWGGDVLRPVASSLNIDVPGQTIPNQVTTPLKSGQFALFTQPPAHLVVDVAGWYRS